MNRWLEMILNKVVTAAEKRGLLRKEALYRLEARRHGVQFIGVFERNGLALFQDPITGSSFAVARNEAVETGVRRVRARFGLSF